MQDFVVCQKLPLVRVISVDEEKALIRAWKENHDVAARDKILSWTMMFIYRKMHRWRLFFNPIMSQSDVYDEMVLQVLYALDLFDLNKGVRFSSYAIKAVKNNFQRILMHNSACLSKDLRSVGNIPMYRILAEYKDVYSHEEWDEDTKLQLLSAQLEISLETARVIHELFHNSVSYLNGTDVDDSVWESNHDLSMLDDYLNQISTESTEDFATRKILVQEILEKSSNKLTEREKEIVNYTFFSPDHDGTSGAELAEELGVSRQCVQTTLKRALIKMQTSLQKSVDKGALKVA